MKKAEAMTLALAVSTALDVLAYNDVVIECRTKPRTLPDFRDWMGDRPFSIAADAWPSMYAVYGKLFDKHLHDPEALAYRDARKHRSPRAAAQERKRGRR